MTSRRNQIPCPRRGQEANRDKSDAGKSAALMHLTVCDCWRGHGVSIWLSKVMGSYGVCQTSPMLIVNATFRLVDGVSDEKFKEIDARFQEDFAYQQKGMLRRTTAKSEDGTWLVMTLWDSAESSDGEKNITESGKAALTAMHDVIDFDTHKLERFFTL